MKTSECRTCGSQIVWATTEKGKKMPLDAEPTSKGRFVLEGDDKDRKAVFVHDDQYTGDRYESHFKTCPQASEHSRRAPAPAKSDCRPDGYGYCATHPPCDMMRVLVDSIRKAIPR